MSSDGSTWPVPYDRGSGDHICQCKLLTFVWLFLQPNLLFHYFEDVRFLLGMCVSICSQSLRNELYSWESNGGSLYENISSSAPYVQNQSSKASLIALAFTDGNGATPTYQCTELCTLYNHCHASRKGPWPFFFFFFFWTEILGLSVASRFYYISVTGLFFVEHWCPNRAKTPVVVSSPSFHWHPAYSYSRAPSYRGVLGTGSMILSATSQSRSCFIPFFHWWGTGIGVCTADGVTHPPWTEVMSSAHPLLHLVGVGMF